MVSVNTLCKNIITVIVNHDTNTVVWVSQGHGKGTSLRTVMNSLAGEVKICGAGIGEVTVTTSNADGSMRDISDILADCRVAFAGLSESEQAAAAAALVGKNAMSGFLALMNAAPADITWLISRLWKMNITTIFFLALAINVSAWSR